MMAVVALVIGLVVYAISDNGTATPLDTAGAFTSRELPAPASLRPGFCRIMRVIDGDTIRVIYQGKECPVRLIGINTPEIANEHKGTGNQAGAVTAAEWLQEIVRVDPQVRLEFDVEQRDKYDRLLAYVYCVHDGKEIMLNEELVRRELAKPKYYSPNGKYRQLLEAASRSSSGSP